MKYGKSRSSEFMKPQKGFNSPESEFIKGKPKMMECDVFAAQKEDLDRLRLDPQDNRGYPYKAFEYQY